ncbi:hypothetical protein KJ877_08795 [bacterium]|nr:hypothetical protein [bacterium]MBU1990794.1 hypothetical protein [bacterium]
MNIDSLVVISWLLATVLLSWILPKKWQIPSGIVSTVAFLAYFDFLSALILISFAWLAYFLPKTFSLKLNILFLCIMIIVLVFTGFKLGNTYDAEFMIPLGLSFYSFRVIHYLIEGYKEKLPQHTFLDVLAYLFFLPTLIVGPINRFMQFKRDIEIRSFAEVNLSYSFERILYGYTKIIVLGNYLISHKLSLYLLEIEQSSPWLYSYLHSVQYWLNLYFQFSGYADIAIGFSALMGFKIMENFHYPFLAVNISAFWLRWHISLSSWIKDYIYAPLAASTRNRFLSLFIAMIAFGLWHELSINYILFGIYHALGITVWHQFQNIKRHNRRLQILFDMKIFVLFSWFLTINFVMMSFEIRSFILHFFGF